MSTHEQRKEAAEKICTDLDGDVKHDIFYNGARSGFMLGCEWEAKSSNPTAVPRWDTMEWWRTEAKAWQALAIANANQCGHLGGQLEDAIKGHGYMPQAAYLTEKARADNLQAELEETQRGEKQWRERAEKAESDLSATRHKLIATQHLHQWVDAVNNACKYLEEERRRLNDSDDSHHGGTL